MRVFQNSMISGRLRRNIATVIAMTLLCLSTQLLAADSRSLRFQHISREQGLSQPFVYTIVQDDEGFMWFGTQDGLNRYDGYEFTVFNHDPDDPTSISDESIRTMISDRSGTLWVGTDAGGLSCYNSARQTFTNFVHDPANPDSLSDNRVRVIYEDSSSTLWIGTDGTGLDRFDRNAGTFEHFPHDPARPGSLAGAHVWSILENSDGHLFVATDGGLSKFDAGTGTFSHYRHDPTDASTINDNNVRVLYEDADKNLWIGTESGGLNRFDYETETFERFMHDPNDPTSISANRINTIFQDDARTLWIGTVDGLNAWNPVTRNFNRYVANASDRYSLSHNMVSSIYQDRGGVLWVGTYVGLDRWNQNYQAMSHYRSGAGNLQGLSEDTVTSFAENQAGDVWIATFGGGLNLLDHHSDQFRILRHVPTDDSSLSSDHVMTLHVDHDDVLWAGTRSSGLNRYDKTTDTFTRFQHNSEDPASISADGITYIIEDSDETLWIGTFGGGLNAFDRQTETFKRYRNDPDNPDSLSNDRILNLFEDRKGIIWIGTYGGGLNRFDPATGKFTAYRGDPDRSDGLSGDEIYMIQEDVWGDFWVAVKGRGLNRWRRADRELGRESFQRFMIRDGLPSSTIYSGVWDEAGFLWLSTGHGLSRLNIESLEFKNYGTSHGLQDDEFNLSAGLVTADGQLFFGGVRGFNAFYPHLLAANVQPPQVAITKFLSLNNPVNPEEIDSAAGYVQLRHDQNVIGFEFAALDYAAPEKNRFMYRLEGLDQGWVDAGTKHAVTYTNLPPGKYTFQVIASNSDQIWTDKAATFDFQMLPALWQTWWAYLFYLSVLAAIVLWAFRAHARSVQQEDKLRYAEELGVIQARLNVAQRIACIGYWEWNTVTNELWWSDEVYRLFQIKPESFDATYEAFLERVHPDDRDDVHRAVEHALSKQEPYAIDHRIVRPDGTELMVHERAETTFDESGQAIGMTGTIHDITERKRAENDIKHRADFQALLAELSSDLIQAQPDDIEQQLRRGLEAIGTRYALDTISVWWFSGRRDGLRPLYQWSRIENDGSYGDLSSDEIPWISKELEAGRLVAIDDVENMPLAAAADQVILRERRLRSLLIIPLLVEEKFVGACAYDVVRNRREWPAGTVAELQLVAENLAGAIARSRAMSRIERLKNKLQRENLYLREEVKLAHGFTEIVGEDPVLKKCLMAVEKVAPTDVTTLILGETGTGKELIARAIHKLSGRCDRPLVSVNCPALPATLIESELFGHEKGAFTGAQSLRRGRFELAHTGTLFLDEIGELPLELQGKLLRVLQAGELQRIGGTATITVDVRLIAATNLNLKQAVELGKFRADLYYRINSFPIALPPLRDRKGDIPLLAEHFVHKHSARLGKRIDAISADMLRELVAYAWPGNVRELESTIERALISAEDRSVLELQGPLRLITKLHQSRSEFSTDQEATLFAAERAHIINVLEQAEWQIAGRHGAASRLGIPPSTLRSKMKRLGIIRQST